MINIKGNTKISIRQILFIMVLLKFTPSFSAENIKEQPLLLLEHIEVTANKYSTKENLLPFSLTILNKDIIKQQRIQKLTDIANWSPSLSISDQGGRTKPTMIMRGLHTNSSNPRSDSNTVATYFGETPLFIDLPLFDIERIEVLLGPQGTLYGSSSLSGLIKYVPSIAELNDTHLKISGELFQNEESDRIGNNSSIIANINLLDDSLALRVSYYHSEKPGYIDYRYLVNESGISNPDPNWITPQELKENLHQQDDVNFQYTHTAKTSLNWAANEDINVQFLYLNQQQKVGGRSISHYQALSTENPLAEKIQKYDSAYRFIEPREIKDSLFSLDIYLELPLATLVSASGFTKSTALGQRDQTDFLLNLNEGFEYFPTFSSFTDEIEHLNTFNQEFRLRSHQNNGYRWLVGFYLNKQKGSFTSKEYTPHFDQFALNVFQASGLLRPDSLEFIYQIDKEKTEKALFAEFTKIINNHWSLTFGARYYQYNILQNVAVDLPLFNTVFLGRAPSSINLQYSQNKHKDNGSLFKLSLQYQYDMNNLYYFTVSEGYRVGGTNGLASCSIDSNNPLCGFEDELTFDADSTLNYETGYKGDFAESTVNIDLSLYYIDWKKAQVEGESLNGQLPITINANSASSVGAELSINTIIHPNLSSRLSYSYTDAQLTQDIPDLFVNFNGIDNPEFYSGKSGDRLSGASKNQLAFSLNYHKNVLINKQINVDYGLTYQSDTYSKVGGKANGEVISGFAVSNISTSLIANKWSLTLYINNLFNKYTYTSVRGDKSLAGMSTFRETNRLNSNKLRTYGHYLLPARTIGIKYTYFFEFD